MRNLDLSNDRSTQISGVDHHFQFWFKVGEWDEWEFATIEKGAVIQERSREITVNPEYGGRKCPSLTEVISFFY